MKEYTYEKNSEVENIYEANNWSDQAFIASIGTEDYYLLMHFPLSHIEEIAATIGSSGKNLFVSLLFVFILFSLYTIIFWAFSNERNRRMRNLIVEGIVDNEDMVLLLNNEGGVEIIKNNRDFKVINVEIGTILPLSSVIFSFSSLLKRDPEAFISSLNTSIESAKKGKGEDIVFVDSFVLDGETNYLQLYV